MADAVIHADSQGQVRSGHVPIRTHRSPPTDDDAVAAGELHDPRRLSPRRARPFATPEQPRRLPIRAARTSSGSGWMDRSRRGGAELSGEGEAPGSVMGAASEASSIRRGSGGGLARRAAAVAVRRLLRSASGSSAAGLRGGYACAAWVGDRGDFRWHRRGVALGGRRGGIRAAW